MVISRAGDVGNPEALIKLGLAHLYNEGSMYWAIAYICLSTPKNKIFHLFLLNKEESFTRQFTVVVRFTQIM